MYRGGLVTESMQLGTLRDLFYQNHFTRLLAAIDDANAGPFAANLSCEAILLKASAYFELNDSTGLQNVIREFSDGRVGPLEEDCLYVCAHLHYFNQDFKAAQDMFLDLLELSDDPNLQFKGLLGLANVLYSIDDFEKLDVILSDLRNFSGSQDRADKICLMILLGNYHAEQTRNYDKAQRYFREALEWSATSCWTYFIARSLLGQAIVSQRSGQLAEMNWCRGMLRAFVGNNEGVRFSHLVCQQFEGEQVPVMGAMEFDRENHRIFITDQWVPLHDKPLLYRFLEIIHGSRQFVSKAVLAAQLWPHEGYRARLHDPRIFDIAKRVRDLVARGDMNSFRLLSGRLGYKLVAT